MRSGLQVCAGGGVETGGGGGALDHAQTTMGQKSSACMSFPSVQLEAVATGGPHDTAVELNLSQLKDPIIPKSV